MPASSCAPRRAGTRPADQQGHRRRRQGGPPVINGAGLVGKVEAASGGSAVVTLITDPEFASAPGALRGSPAASARGRRARRPAVRARRQRRAVRKGELVIRPARSLESRATEVALPAGDPDRHGRRIEFGDGDLERPSTSIPPPTCCSWTWSRS